MFQEGYYRSTTDKYNNLTKGEIFYATVSETQVRIGGWVFDTGEDWQEFEQSFEYIPNGAELRQQKVIDLMNQITTTNIDIGAANSSLLNLTNSEMMSGGPDQVRQVKMAVAQVRNSIERAKKDLATKTEELQAIIAEQTSLMRAKAAEMSKMLSKVEKAIWTINLYLGKNEEIVQINSGEPASTSEPITIRQKVLFMDEECALNPRKDGLDVENIEQFDSWLLEDATNLQQVLPEQKGIVALHIKRHDNKKYDPFDNRKIANTEWTYFLIRNGENLYRVYIDIVVGSTILPNSSEYDEYFEIGNTLERHRPGTDKYMKAMEKAEKAQQHYMRVALVLQGLMDRTEIFKPMPVERIDISNPKDSIEYMRYIYDDDKVLGDGRPKFKEWQREINKQIDVGHRIIGVFDYNASLRKSDYRESRIYPENACYPDSNVLYTIESVKPCTAEKNKYVFRYARTDDLVYRRYGRSHVPTVRACCYIYRSDTFIIDFDAITEEEIVYYLNSRLSRTEYREMIPILKTCAEVKRAEARVEAPFRELLIGQCHKEYKVDIVTIAETIDELIKWWKFKNRTHRALTSDDRKALSMIVAEYGLRRRQKTVREESHDNSQEMVTILLNQDPKPILVAHKSDNQYVAYLPMNDDNVWVAEQTWAYNRTTGNVSVKAHKDWKLVDKRYLRWEILYQSDRWAEWRINPLMAQVLTDAEIANIVDQAVAKLEAERSADGDDEYTWDMFGSRHPRKVRFLPLAATCNPKDYSIELWHSHRTPNIPNKSIISNIYEEPGIRKYDIIWRRKGNEVKWYLRESGDYGGHVANDKQFPWGKKSAVKRWVQNIEIVASEYRDIERLKAAREEMMGRFRHVDRELAQLIIDKRIADERKAYDDEYRDPTLWDDYIDALKEKQYNLKHANVSVIGDAIDLCVENDIDIIGMSIPEVVDAARKFGFTEQQTNQWYHHKNIPTLAEVQAVMAEIPANYVISEAPKEEEEADEEEEEDAETIDEESEEEKDTDTWEGELLTDPSAGINAKPVSATTDQEVSAPTIAAIELQKEPNHE